MIKTVNKQLETAKVHLKKKDFHLAIDILNSIDINDMSDTVLGECYLIKSECLLNLGEFDHGYPDRAISFFKKSAQHNKYALAKYLKGWQLQSLGKSISAKSCLIEAYATAIRAENIVLAGKSLSKLAYILQRAGNIIQAIDNIEKCISLSLKAELFDTAKRMKNNLARLYISCGRFNEALSRFNDFEKKKDNLDQITMYNMMLSHSIVQAYCGNFDKAFELIGKCQNILEKYDRLRFIYFEYNGHILILNGQYKKALVSLHKGLELSLKMAPESDMISQIERLLGDAYLLSGDYTKSEAHTKKSLQVAEKINEKVEIGACYRIFAQLEYQKGNNDNAKEWFKKSIDMFRLINSNYELAVTQFITAKSYLFSDHDTLEMLYEARKYFESEDIKHYVHKVQKELQKNNGRLVKGSQSAVAGFYPTNINSRIQCPDIIAVNNKMVKILDHTKNIASSEMSILLTGETGTGKEIMARYIHYHSGRNDNFVAVNSSAFPNEMFESELFGYKKGAFTGAKDDKPGLFEIAEGGTFFLDEIGDINLESQVKLLRVLDQKSYRRLGENKIRNLNFRLIAATNRNLEQMIKDNLFRADLYFRLKEIAIHLPPLRDRKGDVLALVEYFLQDLGHKINGDAKIVEQLSSILSERQWDGNIRELRNELKRLYLFADKSIEKMIELADKQKPQSESKQLLKLLEKTDWNQSEVARILNVSETTIRRRIKKYNILQSKYSIY